MKTSIINIAGAFTNYFMSGQAYWDKNVLCINEPTYSKYDEYGVYTQIEYTGHNKYKVTRISYFPYDEEYECIYTNLKPEQVIMLVLLHKII